MKRLAAVCAVLALGGAALAGPSDNSLIIGTSQEPTALEPFVNNQAISAEIFSYMYRDVTYTDLQGRPQPDLATELPTEANGRVRITRNASGAPTSMTVRWTLRPGLRWSDGRPLTSEDYRFTHEVFGNEQLPVASRDNYATNFRVIDAQNFELTYSPIYLFYQYGVTGGAGGAGVTGNFVAPAHVWKPLYDRVRAQLQGRTADQQRTLLQQQFLGAPIATSRQGPPVTSGPFRFQRWVPGQSLTMVRNPNYWQQNPTGVQRITYRFFAQTNTLQVQLLAGQLDATSSVGLANSPQTLQAMRQGARNVYDLYQVAGGVWEHMNLNLFTNVREVADLGLADLRTRQALIYAIDRRTLSTQLLGGTVSPTNTFVHPSSPVYSAAGANEYTYNVERANALLAELGWRRGSDNILEKSVGGRTVKFVLELATTAGNAVRERNQQFIRDNLRQVGIDVRINNAPSAVLFDDAFLAHASEGTWKGAIEFAWVGSPITEDAQTIYCDDPASATVRDNVPTSANGFAGQNIGGWCNAEFDRLWAQARVELDAERRRAIFAQMQAIFIREVPMISLYNRLEILTTRKGLQNFIYNGPTRYPSALAWQIGWQQRGQRQVYNPAQASGVSVIR